VHQGNHEANNSAFAAAPHTVDGPPTTASQGLFVACVACLLAAAYAVLCLLTQSGHTCISGARVLPTPQQAAHAAWVAGEAVGVMSCLAFRVSVEGVEALVVRLSASHTTHQVLELSGGAAQALAHAGSSAASTWDSVSALAQQGGLQVLASLAALPALTQVLQAQLLPIAERVAACMGGAAGTAARGVCVGWGACVEAGRAAGPCVRAALGVCTGAGAAAGVATYEAACRCLVHAMPVLQAGAHQAIEVGWMAGVVALNTARRLPDDALRLYVAAQPHLSAATDAALNAAAAAVVALGLGEGDDQEGGEEVGGEGGDAGGAAARRGRVLRLRSGASRGQGYQHQQQHQQQQTPGASVGHLQLLLVL